LRINAAKLEREVGLRHIDGARFMSVLGDGPKGEFEIEYGAEDQDSLLLALSPRVLLQNAGWKLINEKAIPLAVLLKEATIFPMNVRIQLRQIAGDDRSLTLPQAENKSPRTLYSVLSGAIMAGLDGLLPHIVGSGDPSLPEGRVRITVSRDKPRTLGSQVYNSPTFHDARISLGKLQYRVWGYWVWVQSIKTQHGIKSSRVTALCYRQ
jgi:hypothetical protein